MNGRKYDYVYSSINEKIAEPYGLQSYVRIGVGVGAVIGALAGLGISFTALSPLVIGGVVGAVFAALLALVAIGLRCYYRNEINEEKRKEGIVEKRVIAALTPPFLFAAIASVATGVSLAATANAVLPGVFATWWAIHECVMSDSDVLGPRTA